MLRFILALFGRSYESCKGCELLKEQLEYERSTNKEMLETLTSLLKPQTVIVDSSQPKPITPKFTMWSRRRSELERLDKESMKIRTSSPVIAKPDEMIPKTTDQLEEELGLAETKKGA